MRKIHIQNPALIEKLKFAQKYNQLVQATF